LENRILLSATKEVLGPPPVLAPLVGADLVAPAATEEAKGTAASSAAAAAGTKAWTIMIYLDADNNLESYGIADVNEMEAALSSDQVNVIVEMDRRPGYDTSNGNWTDTRVGVIQRDPANSSKFVTTFTPVNPTGNSELDMGNPNTLTQFIQYSVSNLAATNYALVLWDHGGGLNGVCWDDSNGNDNLTVKEVSSAIALSGVHLSAVGFDTCLAGMYEQLYQLRNATDVVVASEQTIPVNGWDYTGLLNRVVANPTLGAEDFGRAAVAAYGAYYGNSQTLAATRTSAYGNLSQKLTDFSNAVLASTTTADWNALISARGNTPYFTDTSYRDLVGYMRQVVSSGVTAGIKTAAQAVILAATDPAAGAIIVNHSGSKVGGTGISIYLPSSNQGTGWLSVYNGTNYDLAVNTTWTSSCVCWSPRNRAVVAKAVQAGQPTHESTIRYTSYMTQGYC